MIFLGAMFGLVVFSIVEAAIHDFSGSRVKPTVAVVIALGIGMFACSRGLTLVNRELDVDVQLFKIPTAGMHPTLLVGDHLAVDRAAYGFRNSLTENWFWRRGDIQRGDIAVFLFPEDRSRPFIKRVVGLPGETIEIRDNVVFVDGIGLDEPYVHFLRPPPSDDTVRDTWGPEVVPESQLFVLGDNRDNSRDSRYWGFVPVADVLGKAGVVYWSIVVVDPPASWASRIRWDRMGMRLR